MLQLTTETYKLKKEPDSEPQPVLKLKGLLKNKDAFNSISLNLIGHFLLLCEVSKISKGRDSELWHNYSKKAAVLASFGLCIHTWLDNYTNQDLLGLLYSKASNLLHVVTEADLEHYYHQSKCTLLDLSSVLEGHGKLKESVELIENELKLPLDEAAYFRTERLGVTAISKKYPATEPKSLLLSFPGTHYDEAKRSFIFPYIFNIKNNSWFKPVPKK